MEHCPGIMQDPKASIYIELFDIHRKKTLETLRNVIFELSPDVQETMG